MDTKKETKNTNLFIVILFECLLAFLAYCINDNAIKIVLFTAIFYYAWFSKKLNPTLILLAVFPAMNFDAGGFQTMVITLPAYINGDTLKILKEKKRILLTILLMAIVLISFVGGINSDFNELLLFLRCILLFINIMNSNTVEDEFRLYAYAQFFVIASILVNQLTNGSISLYWGRLALNGNVRELANTVAVPTFVTGTAFLVKNKRMLLKLADFVILGICLFILLATSSRGVLISAFIAILVYYFSSIKEHKKILTIAVIALLVFWLVNYISSLGYFRIDRLLVDETGGMNGRVDIWTDYIKYQFSSIRTALIGFGPGKVSELNINGYYSHSLFMDWLFSYGVLGVTFLAVVLVKIFCKLFSSKDKFSFSLFLLSCLLFSTHGVASDLMFYILVGVSCCNLETSDKLLTTEEANEQKIKKKKIRT